MASPLKHVLIGASVTAALLSVVTSPAYARPSGSAVHRGGVVTNGQFCNQSYEDVSHRQFVITPGTFGASLCMRYRGRSQETARGFKVTRFSGHKGGVNAYPNIFAGYEWGRHPDRSFEPVRARNSGNPWSSVHWNSHPDLVGHVGYDIWFSKTKPADPSRLGQNFGAEIMIWLTGSHGWQPGHAHVILDGRRWNMRWWLTNHHGGHWPLIIFSTAQGRPHGFSGSLKPFMAYASRHTPMRMNYWLTAIDFGVELFSRSQATGFTVRDFRLTGLRTAGYQTRSFTSRARATAEYTARRDGQSGHATVTVTRLVTRMATVPGYSRDWRANGAKALAEARSAATRVSWSRARAAARAKAKAEAIAFLNQKLDPRVPNVLGETLTAALTRLRTFGYHKIRAPESVKGHTLLVTRVTPKPGTHYALSRTVTLRARVK